MNSSFPIVQSNPLIPSNSSVKELDRIDRLIQEGKEGEALKELLFVLQDPATIADLEKTYKQLFVLFPFIDEKSFGILIKRLPSFLNLTSHLAKQQSHLAIMMGEGYGKQKIFKEGICCFGKAIKIAESRNDNNLARQAHCKASELLLNSIQTTFLPINLFKEKLERARGKNDSNEFGLLLERIKSLRKFCYCEEGINYIEELYLQGRDVLSEKEAPGGFYRFIAEIKKERDAPNQPLQFYVTERYRQGLKQFRDLFKTLSDGNDLRAFQNLIAVQIRNFFQLLVNDAIAVLGPPPCSYDIRSIGSVGREEPLPFSDLEFFILIEDDEHLDYFKTLLKFIELQVLSLGETAGKEIVFTCLGNKNESGFHFDSGANPLEIEELMGTPFKLAGLQKLPITNLDDPPTARANQILKSQTLLINNNPQFFNDFKEALNEILESGIGKKQRQIRGMELFKRRFLDFRKSGPSEILLSPLNIKNQYTQFLNFLLSDMALYWGLEETNTLDIVDALVVKEVFTKTAGELLKDAVSDVYRIRIRLHEFYNEQNEEVHFSGLSGCILNKNEKDQLEKIYWLILRPLYHFCLQKIFDGEKPVEQIFFKLDFISVAIEEVCSSQKDPNIYIPFIEFASGSPVPFSSHLENYRRLSHRSDLEVLRVAYFEGVKKQVSEDEMRIILEFPNRSGLRLAFMQNELVLKRNIEEISSKVYHKIKNVSQVKMISSAGIRFLKPEVISEILDEEGYLKNSYPKSAHRVVSVQGLHLKEKPTHPLMEYAIHNLLYRLAGKLTPASELVRFEVDGERMFPVLISKTVDGGTLKEFQVKEFDLGENQWDKWTWMLLACILTRPGDGLLSNYLLDKELNIFCVDNDISFVEPVFKKGGSHINFCSALFCLFKERGLDREVLKQFCLLDADAILTSWIEDVIQREGEYLKLFSEQERKQLYEEDPKNRFKATILFREGALATLNMQFVYLQNQISSCLQKNVVMTPIDLLSHLIILRESLSMDNAPGLIVSKSYQKATQPSIEDRLKWITSRMDGKSLTSMQSDQACLGKIPTLDEVQQRKIFSPAKAKEELLGSLLRNSASFLSIGFVRGKETIRASFKKIVEGDKPDVGRQALVLSSLASLIKQQDQRAVSVTLQHCAVLNSATLVPFLHEGLEYLDLRYCPFIKNADIQMIQKKCPKLKELYLSGCQGLTEISEYENPRGRSPVIKFSHLRVLYLEKCPNLVTLRLKCPSLTTVKGNDNSKLQNIELLSLALSDAAFENCPKLKKEDVEAQLSRIEYEGYFDDIEMIAGNIDGFQDVIIAGIRKNPELSEYLYELNSEHLFSFLNDYLSSKDGLFLRYLGIRLRQNRGLINIAVRQNGLALKHAAEKFRRDRGIVLEAVMQNPQALDYAADELMSDRDFIFELLKLKGKSIDSLDKSMDDEFFSFGSKVSIKKNAFPFEEILDDILPTKEFLFREMRKAGKKLFFRDEEMLRDEEFLLETIRGEPQFLQYVRNELQPFKEDWKFCAKALRHGKVLEYLNTKFRSDRDLVAIAVASDGAAFEFAGDELKRDKPIVLDMVKRNGTALEFACDELKNDREVVLVAVRNDGKSLKFANITFRDQPKIVLESVQSSRSQLCSPLEYASVRLRLDKEIVLAAVTKQGCALEFASNEFKDNEKIVLKAVRNFGLSIAFASARLRGNPEIVLEAIQENWQAFYFASDELKNDRDFIRRLLRINSKVINYADKKLQEDPEFDYYINKSTAYPFI